VLKDLAAVMKAKVDARPTWLALVSGDKRWKKALSHAMRTLPPDGGTSVTGKRQAAESGGGTSDRVKLLAV
jgi:hypothetical protein